MNRWGRMVSEIGKSAAALMPVALAIVIGLVFGPAPAKALSSYSGIENDSSNISMWAVSMLDYDTDCEFYRLCAAYAEAQEYVDGNNTPTNWSTDEEDVTAQANLQDFNVFPGSTYTVVGYHYYWNDPDGDIGDGGWIDYGWECSSLTVPLPLPPTPEISGISPWNGVAGLSGYIAIYGLNLSGDGSANDVSVTMDNSDLSVVYVSDGQVNVYYSNLTAGDHSITVWTSGGGSNSATFTGYNQDPTPVISSVSPGTWSYTQSNSLTISGSGFGTSPSVYASYPDGAQETLSVTNAADTLIYATANHLSTVAGWVALTVQSNGYWNQGFVGNLPDSSTDSNAGYVPVPTITSVSQTQFTGGDSNVLVTISGNNFPGAPSLSFSDSGVSYSGLQLVNNSSITFLVAVADEDPGGSMTMTVTFAGLVSGAVFQMNVNPSHIKVKSGPALWYFDLDANGNANVPPSSFTQGAIQTPLTASSKTAGSYMWTIVQPANATQVSFAPAGSPVVNQITTSYSVATLYAVGYGIHANDVTINVTWSYGAQSSTATLALGVDSPYMLVNKGIVGPRAVGDCAPNFPAGANGWDVAYTWDMMSRFGVEIQGQSFNEFFSNVQQYQTTNLSYTPNGKLGVAGASMFTDHYCYANQVAGIPKPTVPQAPLGTNAIDSATQLYSVGSATVDIGTPVLRQTLTRYVDHAATSGTTSPVRNQ